jgi:hypothetical protein
MHDQTRSWIAIGIFALTILIVVVVPLVRSRRDVKAPPLVAFVISSCFFAVTASTWSLCYMGFVSGVMMSIESLAEHWKRLGKRAGELLDRAGVCLPPGRCFLVDGSPDTAGAKGQRMTVASTEIQ